MIKIPDINSVVTKTESGIGAKPPQSNNGLSVSLGGSKNGYVEYISDVSSGTATNMPTKTFLGYKAHYSHSSGHAYVVLYEVYPNPGNIWTNAYNTNWKGWKLAAGRISLWSGTATVGSTVTIAAAKALFNSIDIYFTTGERINCPLTDGNEDVWGSLLTTAGTQFYLKSVHVQFVSATQVKVVSCQEFDMATGVVGNRSIVKIVGRP